MQEGEKFCKNERYEETKIKLQEGGGFKLAN